MDKNTSHSEAFDRNAKAYAVLFNLENAVRAFIAQKLEEKFGNDWIKRQIPSDLKKKIADHLSFERSFRWQTFIPHPPLFYIDFSELQKIVIQNNNWSGVFESIFSPKDIFIAAMREAELVRNKICHSRLITEAELELLVGIERKVQSCVGLSVYNTLVSESLDRRDIPADLAQVREYLVNAANQVVSLKACDFPDDVKRVTGAWWFDSDFLPVNIVKNSMADLRKYSEWPVVRGEGHKLEEWTQCSDLVQRLRDSAKLLDEIIKSA